MTASPRRPGRASGPARGRPTKFRPEYVEIAATLAKNGATDHDVAAALGVAIRTIWRWQAEHSEFCRALVVPPGAPDDRVERSLFQRSVGYTYDSEKVFQHEGAPVRVPITEHVPPDPGAAMKWLTNRRPDRWRDKQALEHTGKDGSPLAPEPTTREVARAVLTLFKEAARGSPPTTHPQDEEDEVDYSPDDDEGTVDDATVATDSPAHMGEATVTPDQSDEAEAPPPRQPPPPSRMRVFNPITGRLE